MNRNGYIHNNIEVRNGIRNGEECKRNGGGMEEEWRRNGKDERDLLCSLSQSLEVDGSELTDLRRLNL